jgi:predicted PurR-regulated permease PerM
MDNRDLNKLNSKLNAVHGQLKDQIQTVVRELETIQDNPKLTQQLDEIVELLRTVGDRHEELQLALEDNQKQTLDLSKKLLTICTLVNVISGFLLQLPIVSFFFKRFVNKYHE